MLNFDGHVLSRDILLRCMGLAAEIAANGSELSLCFVEARRMAELVDTLAVASRSILKADEMGAKTGKKSKKTTGQNLEIWNIKAGT